MSGFPPTQDLLLVQIGPLDSAEVDNAVGLAKQTQTAFRFSWHPRRIPLNRRHKLPNGGFDLDQLVDSYLTTDAFTKPVVFLTSAPYSSRDKGRKKGYFYFGDYGLGDDPSVSIVSTYLWPSIAGGRPLQSYILLSLGIAVLSYSTNLQMHDETRGCICDYCEKEADIGRVFGGAELCVECRSFLSRVTRERHGAVRDIASALRLVHRAQQKKQAFVVMPLSRRFNPVYATIRQVLISQGWTVLRADELSYPRRITDAIVEAILTSDLVVADITGDNPNVFWELGYAHAASSDVIMLKQPGRIPFDVAPERAVTYRPNRLGRLTTELAAKVEALG